MFQSRLNICVVILVLFISLGTALAANRVVIGDFSLGFDEKGVPVGWQLKERTGKAEYSIVKEGDIHALHLRSADTSFSFQKSVDLDVRDYPVLSWKWKVTKLPVGGDFRNSKTDDQAAQLFIAFSNAKTIVYIWDTNAPKGLVEDAWAPPFIDIKAVVVRSGESDIGKWLSESRNAYEDYLRLYGHEPPRVAGIRIQINSQHTDSYGESFFSDVAFEKQS